jgi:hypothetical protein
MQDQGTERCASCVGDRAVTLISEKNSPAMKKALCWRRRNRGDGIEIAASEKEVHLTHQKHTKIVLQMTMKYWRGQTSANDPIDQCSLIIGPSLGNSRELRNEN